MVPPAVAMMVAGYMSASVTSMARVMGDTGAACPRQGRRRRDEKYNHGDQVDIPEPLHALGGARRGHRLGLVSHYSLLRWEALAARAPSSDGARGDSSARGLLARCHRSPASHLRGDSHRRRA